MKESSRSFSLWEDTVNLNSWPRLEGVAQADVLIIGGGMAGMLIARKLQEKGVACIVAEGHQIGAGITAGTTAKITSQQGFLYQKLVPAVGREQAGMYLETAEQAIDAYEALAREIPCDFVRKSNIIYTLRGRQRAEKEMEALQKLDYPARFREKTSLPFPVDGAVEFPNQACFHPLKLLKGLTTDDGESAGGIGSGLTIFENTKVRRLKQWRDGGWEAQCDHGMIFADQVVLATHFPIFKLSGAYFMKMYQSRSYVIAGQPRGKDAKQKLPGSQHSDGGNLDGMYLDESGQGLSFREADGLLLLGGMAARTGAAGRKGKSGSWELLEKQARDLYPAWRTRYCWGAQDCMTLDGLPYIGSCGKRKKGLWVATGFNKWGMTGSMMAALMLAELVTGGEHPCEELLRPSRPMELLPLLENGASAVKNLLTPTLPRCRHLGCALKWNAVEQTWDCPCHGSRYQKDGTCIEGPSKRDLPR